MNKIIGLLLILALTISFTACSNTRNSTDDMQTNNVVVESNNEEETQQPQTESQIQNTRLNETESAVTATANYGVFTIIEEFDRTIYEFYHPDFERIVNGNSDVYINIFYMLEGEGDEDTNYTTVDGKYHSTTTRVSAYFYHEENYFYVEYQDENEEYYYPDYKFENNTFSWIFTESGFKPSEYEFIIFDIYTEEEFLRYGEHLTNDMFVKGTREEAIIEFVNPNLEALIRFLMEKAEEEPITYIELEEIIVLNVRPPSPTDNTFALEIQFKNNGWNNAYLTIGEMIDNGIADENGEIHFTTLEDLQYMKKIKTLHLQSCGITNISVLSEFENLTYLRLRDNDIADISALLHHVNLKTLHLNENNISDVSPLENMQFLEYLYLDFNNISDITALSNLQSLQELSLVRNPISDVSALENLQNLHYLNLWSANVTDLSPVYHVESLYAD